MVVVIFATIIISCKDDDEGEAAFELSALTANDIDLNGATSPSDVPTDAIITATFAADVDPASATTTNVKLIRDYDDAEIPLSVSGSGKTLTIDPVDPLGTGTLYLLQLGAGLMSSGGQPFAAVERSFTTAGTFAPAGVVAHWSFENSAEDIVGDYDAAAENVIDITYAASRSEAAGQAAVLNGTSSIIEVPNGSQLLSSQFAVSFWVFLNNDGKTTGNFTFGIGNFHGLQFEMAADAKFFKFAQGIELEDGTTVTNDFAFDANGKTNQNLATADEQKGIDNATTLDKEYGGDGIQQLIANKWAHITFVFDGANKTRALYINGEPVMKQDLKLLSGASVDAGLKPLATAKGLKFIPVDPSSTDGTYNDNLAFGWWQNRDAGFGTAWGDWAVFTNPGANHFRGMLDDFRFFNTALTDTEIQLMYNSEKP
ncbi:MAG TPA: LamG-like jellyroll fold domain-containing protein [Cytophagales bacterium]|nr:LamG-like jellyroll fold domain-containing protein [Cytophagales bacterium]